MASNKKNPLPFDSKGGVVVMRRLMIESHQWLSLSSQAKVLMVLLQVHWRNDFPVGYGIREAAANIPCDRKTAMRAFKELTKAGFIEMVDESLFCTRTVSKSRTWRLTWLPYKSRPPTSEWKNHASDGNPAPLEPS